MRAWHRLVLWGLPIAAAACAHPAVDEAPAPLAPSAAATRPGDSLAAPSRSDSPPAISDDSAADLAALEALAALEFRAAAGDTGTAEHHRAVDDETTRLFGPAHGGATGSAEPTYDIDVESFANHDRVQYYMDFFLGPARDRFAIWLTRLPRYEGMIRERLRRYGVPEDLVYLALIESGYSNTAVSHARAVGIWQFIAGTGRRYGLKQDEWVDERRDPFRATDAAARHLADLNEEFGSWYLAAAAYNAGAGRVTRGLKRLPEGEGDAPSDSTFFALYDKRYLRRETRDYVPKLIAAALIAKEPKRYGFDSLPALAPFQFDEVEVTAATGLDVLARLADTTTAALVELNPQLYRGVTPPGREVTVRVPLGTGPHVALAWAGLPPSERVSFLDHRVARGETLSGIAARYHVSLQLLRAANPGVKPTRLSIGQRLTIPVSAAARRDVANGRRPRTVAAAVAAAGPSTRYHTVRAGDSLWTIARRYGVRVADLRRWNDVEGDLVRVGQRLRVAAP
jgi:membrane-bound lytic murein transglycosylase D